jgi:starch synthase
MACGIPVVATRVGGIPEIVVHGQTGLLVDVPTDGPADGDPAVVGALATAINELVTDPARGRAMGEAGRARAADQFSWTDVATRTMEVYESVVR